MKWDYAGEFMNHPIYLEPGEKLNLSYKIALLFLRVIPDKITAKTESGGKGE